MATVDYEALRPLGSAAQLTNVYTMHWAVRAHKVLFGADLDLLPRQIRWRVERVDTEPGLLIAKIFCEFTAMEEHGTPLLEASGELLAVYKLPELSVSTQTLDHFAQVNGVYNTWPFIRELLTTGAQRVGGWVRPIPSFRPPPSVGPIGSWETIDAHGLGAEE